MRPPVKTRLVGGNINLNEQARGARDDDQLERRIDAGRTGWYRSIGAGSLRPWQNFLVLFERLVKCLTLQTPPKNTIHGYTDDRSMHSAKMKR